jgi:protein gp37
LEGVFPKLGSYNPTIIDKSISSEALMVQNALAAKSKMWNPWHGCHKLSAGCLNCYVYRGDSKRGIDSSLVTKTKSFDLPIQKKRNGDYKIPAGSMVYTCFTSDFLIQEADDWRMEAWSMIRQRSDLHFMIITKRIDRFSQLLPEDWGGGYNHVTICCTVENQERADYRLPIYRMAPIQHKIIICEPLLAPIDLSAYHIGEWIQQVVVGGESGHDARVCNFDWVKALHNLCVVQNVSFWFKQTGAKLVKEGRLYSIPRQFQHSQARNAGINFTVA